MAKKPDPPDNGQNTDDNVTSILGASVEVQGGDYSVSIPDHLVSAAAARNSQDAQRHSITTAAYWAFIVPVCIAVFISFYPITTRFVDLDVQRGNFVKSNGIGVVVQPGAAPNKRVVKIRNETREDILEFIVNFEFGVSSLTDIVFTPAPGEYVDVYTVGKRQNADGSFEAALGVKNLRKSNAITVGLVFQESAEGFGFLAISGDNVSRWEGVWHFLTFRFNWAYMIVGAGGVLFLLWRLVKPYAVNTRAAMRVSRYVDSYIEHQRVDESAVNPVGQKLDTIVDHMQILVDGNDLAPGRNQRRDLVTLLKLHGLISVEAIEGGRSEEDTQRALIGAMNVLGHPTFGKFWFFRGLNILVFHLGADGRVTAWNHVTVNKLLKPTGEMIKLQKS